MFAVFSQHCKVSKNVVGAVHFLQCDCELVMFYFCSILKEIFSINIMTALILYVTDGSCPFPILPLHNCKPWVCRLVLLTILVFYCAKISGLCNGRASIGFFHNGSWHSFSYACVIVSRMLFPPIFCMITFK